jgi:type IV pilus assembly protein PilA
MLVVVLIIGILMAVAMPLYLSAIANSATVACRANMQSISNAAQAWKTRTRAADYTTCTLSALTPDMGAIPFCPSGGTYTLVFTGNVNNSLGVATAIPTGSFGVNCSATGHYGFIPGVMTQ